MRRPWAVLLRHQKDHAGELAMAVMSWYRFRRRNSVLFPATRNNINTCIFFGLRSASSLQSHEQRSNTVA
jgi:hypothetical protein